MYIMYSLILLRASNVYIIWIFLLILFRASNVCIIWIFLRFCVLGSLFDIALRI